MHRVVVIHAGHRLSVRALNGSLPAFSSRTVTEGKCASCSAQQTEKTQATFLHAMTGCVNIT
jgi:hypothetical protein